MGIFTKGPQKCGVCRKVTNCKCGEKRKDTTKRVKTQTTAKTTRGTTISYTTTKTVPTGNFTKGGNSFCGKCKSRIVNGVHSGVCAP